MRKHRHRIAVGALLAVSTFANLVDVKAASAATGVAASAAGATLHEGFIDVPAGRLFYRDSGGTGPVVVFLHPASGNSAVFEQQVEPLVRAGFRFIAYDRAGVGRSTRATGDGAPRGDVAPELEQVMDALHVRRFHIVGAAAGGGIGLQYALYRPERVASITVANSIGNVQDAAYTEMSARIRPPAFNALPPEVRELGPSYRAANPEGVKRWLEANGERTETRPAPPAGGSTGAVVAPTGPPPGSAPGGGSPVTFAALEKMTVPTLLMTGDADLWTPPSVLRLFKQHMPRAEMEVIADSGHAAHWENPAAFNRRVLAFLRKHRK
jgi:pimeloyl-ACP methyl ester carboxylesterase